MRRIKALAAAVLVAGALLVPTSQASALQTTRAYQVMTFSVVVSGLLRPRFGPVQNAPRYPQPFGVYPPGNTNLVITQNTSTLNANYGTTTYTCALSINTNYTASYSLVDWAYGTHSGGTGTFPLENYPATSYLSWAVPDLSSTYHTYYNSGSPGELVWRSSTAGSQTHCIDLSLTVPRTVSAGTYSAQVQYTLLV